MRRALAIFGALLSLTPCGTARACDPEDARVFVAATDDGFVFVARQTVLRLSTTGEVRHRRALSDEAGVVHLLADGRTLLHLVPTGEVIDCRATRVRFELVDSAGDAPPRVIGRFPARGDGVGVRELAARADGALTVRLETYDAGGDRLTYDDVQVRPDTRRVRAVRVRSRDGQAPPPLASPAAGPLRAVSRDDADALEVRDASGAVRVLVALGARMAAWALSADGRQLAIATYSVVNEDYGTGWEARLEIVDLASGTRVASYGEGTAITAIRGSVRVTCEERVHDPGSDLNVRAAPNTRAPVVATLAHGRTVTVSESRGRWRRLSAPAEGWVWAGSLARECIAAPP